MELDLFKYVQIFAKLTRYEYIEPGSYKCPFGDRNSTGEIRFSQPESFSVSF